MKVKFRGLSRAVFICAVLALTSCATGRVTIEKGSVSGCQRRLLIASEVSDFKNDVVEQLTDSLEDEYCYLKVVDIEGINSEQSDMFEAIAIVDTIVMMQMSDNAQKFIDNSSDKTKIKVLVTSGGSHDFTFEHVDAVSSASDIKAGKGSVDTLISKVAQTLRRN